MSQKIGVVDVVGGLRGIYAAGIFDYFLDNHITFDLGIGVSAGSANLASYIAKQPRRNFTFFAEYAMRKEYMGWGNFFHKKSFIDLDYVYSTLCNTTGEYPLDYSTMIKNPMELYVVASDAYTGEPKDKMLANRIRKQYPLSAARLEARYAQYNEAVALAKEYEREGKLLIIAPDNTCGVGTLSRDSNALHQLYAKGYSDAVCIRSFI